MVDGFRWKPILGSYSFLTEPISSLILSSHHHYTYHYQFILLHLSPHRYHIHIRHPQVHGSRIHYRCCIPYMRCGFLSLVASLMCRSDSVVFGLPGSCRFMDPHGLARSSSLTGCSLRRGHDRYLIMIPQWSLPRAIQLGPHFSALRCHHASPSGRYILDLWA
ncbi:hypothetical protein AAG906_034510 [Vitis piasezkii]